MKKLVSYLLLASFVLTAAFSVAGCSEEELIAEYADGIKDVYCYYKEEFDLEPYIVKQEGVSYTVKAEQVDSDMNTHELTVNGFKFTPQLNEDVYITFTAQRGDQKVTSKEYKMYCEVRVDPIVAYYNAYWKDDGFMKEVNLDPQYIVSGRNTSTKVTWFGKEVRDKDRWQYVSTVIGDEITDYYSVTDWTDAVLTFWVYNTTEYEIEFSPIWSHDGAGFELYSDPRTATEAAPNGWTEIKYSLRYYGMTENFFYDHDLHYTMPEVNEHWGYGTAADGWKRLNQNWWTCRWGGREKVGKSYTYTFYIDGFDIRNYDPVKDADLDHEYRGFWNQPIERGSNMDIPVKDNDGVTLSFEYKITDGEQFGAALIEENMSTNYLGYYTFTKDGALDEYLGVTVTDLEDGFKRVVINIAETDVMVGDTKPAVIKKIFIRDIYNNADFIIRNAA